MKAGGLYILFMCWMQLAVAQFNPHYNAYMFNGLSINPASAGSREALSVTGVYNRQWMQVAGSPATVSVSAHTPLKNRHYAVGLNVFNDQVGVQDHLGIYPVFAYHVQLAKTHFLSLGVSPGVSVYQSRWSDLKTVVPDDPTFGQRQTATYFNTGLGAYYYTPKVYFGVSTPMLFQPQSKDVFRPGKGRYSFKDPIFIATAGAIVAFGQQVKWKPSFLVNFLSVHHADIHLNSNFYFNDLVMLGFSYRHESSVVALIGVQINPQFNFGYSYAYATTFKHTGGGHELVVRYELKKHVQSLNPRYF